MANNWMYLVCRECHEDARLRGLNEWDLRPEERSRFHLAKTMADGYYPPCANSEESAEYTAALEQWFNEHRFHGGRTSADVPYFIDYENRDSVHV